MILARQIPGIVCATVLTVAGLVPAQPPAGDPARRTGVRREDSVLLVVDHGHPTDWTLARALAERLGKEKRAVTMVGLGPQGLRAIAREDATPGTLMVAVGQPARDAILRHSKRAPLLVTGRQGAAAAPPQGRPVVTLPLEGNATSLGRLAGRYLGEVRRLGILGRRGFGDIDMPRAERVEIAEVGDADLDALVIDLAPRVDALYVRDDPRLAALAPALLEAARRQKLPIVTDAPWLARAGAPLAAIPDFSLWALRLRRALQRLKKGLPLDAKLSAPKLKTRVDPAALRRLDIVIDPVRLAREDRLDLRESESR